MRPRIVSPTRCGLSAMMTPAALQRADLALGIGSGIACNGAGMAHAAFRRRMPPDDEGDDRDFRLGRGDELGQFFLVRSADFSYDDDAVSIGVGKEEFEAGAHAEAVNGVAANADRGRLAKSGVAQLRNDLAGQRCGTRQDADIAAPRIAGRHDADLADAGGENALRVRSDENGGALLQGIAHTHHIANWNPLRERHDERHLRFDRLDHRIRRPIRWNEEHAGIGAGLRHG